MIGCHDCGCREGAIHLATCRTLKFNSMLHDRGRYPLPLVKRKRRGHVSPLEVDMVQTMAVFAAAAEAWLTWTQGRPTVFAHVEIHEHTR
jgi:hypothetical protein